jgi:hypothetical protein
LSAAQGAVICIMIKWSPRFEEVKLLYEQAIIVAWVG